jgi:hypothetical protein
MSGDDEPSDYEKLRLANICRNASVLTDLGLDDKTISVRQRRRGNISSSTSGSNPSSARSAKRSKPPPAEPARRSSRAAGQPAPNYKEAADFRASELGEGRGASGGGAGDPAEDDGLRWAATPRPRTASSIAPPPDAASSRAMLCNLEAAVGPVQLGRAVGRNNPSPFTTSTAPT